MATTAIFPIHAGRRSVAKALKGVVDYMANPLKTDSGEFVSSYECAPETVDLEFSMAQDQYHLLTGRDQGKKSVIAYQARQSFAPDEITPEEANRLGYELAMRFTKGRYSFVVCTHVNTNCVHNHVVWNSVALDCRRKFRNFFLSAFALRRVSDLICAENGLSIIEKQKPSPGKDYAKYMFGDNRPPSFQNRLRAAINDVLARSPTTFEDFIALIRAAGIVAERRGRHMRFKLPDQKSFTRLETLGGDHTEEAIRERIEGRRIVSSTARPAVRGSGGDMAAPAGKAPATVDVVVTEVPSLLIDIERKMREGKGPGYAHWATVRNIKSMAKTLIYLQERGLGNYAKR
jgi:hypothetical protein